jgi:hypothetical protein
MTVLIRETTFSAVLVADLRTVGAAAPGGIRRRKNYFRRLYGLQTGVFGWQKMLTSLLTRLFQLFTRKRIVPAAAV